MRVIAGTLRSRALKAPPGLSTRPTSDRLRETLFNVLAPRIEGSGFLDLYAGSGAVGIEAVSRGAAHVTCVEQSAAALTVLRANLTALNLASHLRVEALTVADFLRRATLANQTFDLIFLDPPYDEGQEYVATLGSLDTLLEPSGLVIVEHRRKQEVGAYFGRLSRKRILEQGDAALSFYSLEDSE